MGLLHGELASKLASVLSIHSGVPEDSVVLDRYSLLNEVIAFQDKKLTANDYKVRSLCLESGCHFWKPNVDRNARPDPFALAWNLVRREIIDISTVLKK